MDHVYHVKLEVFEGPLDLLYHLVQEQEIDIWDIPIARITEQYLQYLDAMRELDIEVAAEFLVMAARLVYIKAKMLLPDQREATEEEEGGDPRAGLAEALQEYALFKEAARRLSELGEGRDALLPRPHSFALPKGAPVYEDPTGGLTVEQLAEAFRKVLDSRKPPRPIPIPSVKVSVAEKVAALRRFFGLRRRALFTSLFPQRATRPEIVATFLALLELVRRRFVLARQEEPFGPIVIERCRHPELLGEGRNEA